MAGEISSGPSTPESPNSGGFNTDQLPHTTSRSSWNFSYTDDDEAAVDPEIIRDYPDDIPEEEEEVEDLYNENFLDDFRRMGEHDQYESVGLDNSLEDERDMDQIMADLRAAEMELDDRDGPLTSTHSEEDNYRPSKRARADFRPPVVPRSNDDADGMQISPGWSQRDVLTTDHTFILMKSPTRMKRMRTESLRCTACREH